MYTDTECQMENETNAHREKDFHVESSKEIQRKITERETGRQAN